MGLERGDETKRSNLSSRVSCRQAVPIATATNMNFDDIQPSRANHPRQLDNTAFRNESDPCRMNETCGGSDVMDQFPPGVGINGTDLAGSEEFTQLQTKLCDDNAAPRPASNDSSTRSNLTPPQPPMLNGDRHSNKMPLTPPKVPASLSNPRVQSGNSQCGHPTSAGQELCYLCHQRRRRNQAIYFTEELKRREEEEDRLLQAYQEMKDAEYIMRDQDNMLAKRHDCQKISAFNLGASEAIRQRKNFRDPNFYRSYIFQRRPLTPSKSIKQKDLSEELDKQIAEKETSKEKLRSDETFLERLEQIQLVEDLAAQREQYLREKKDQKEMYRRALSAQLRYKPAQLPEREPNSLEPVFGKNDLNEQKMLEKRRLAQEIQDEQMQAVAAKKREAILKKIQDQKSEEETIKKTKENLIRDRANRYKRRLDNRRNLESEWFKAMEEKEQNELLDRLRVATPGGLLHEQCDKYYRCSQCQRKVANVGETNIWSDTYYIPGSRYIC